MRKIFVLLAIAMLFIALFTTLAAAKDNSYTVKTGDSLWKISQSFNIPLEEIMEINNLNHPSLIFVGQKLIITDKNENSDYITYTINPGDILWSIAQCYGTTVEKLVQLNNINNAYDLYIGRKLLVPVPNYHSSQLYHINSYRVQTGENLTEIADYYGLSEQELRTINYLKKDEQVYPGQQ
ncbi:MAG: LysM peptidoglycan-binding domain-containing protein, partial [Halanaerobiaceae bacterium]